MHFNKYLRDHVVGYFGSIDHRYLLIIRKMVYMRTMFEEQFNQRFVSI